MVTMTINGEVRPMTAPQDTPLLWVLRDELGLTGTKFGCGMGLCGACTVLIDGQPVRSCTVPIGGLTGAKVRTIEGLSPDRSHPVQQAWIEQQVPQCGYCQSGMIMASVALLERNARPSDADIEEAITNICRCGTYQRVKKAIHIAAAKPRR
jgi:isoquinoline 1-oxidoreductase alpha subunit